ncbi:MAG TPA: hypothetical protein VH592_19350 [Gemmataceae bacterium]
MPGVTLPPTGRVALRNPGQLRATRPADVAPGKEEGRRLPDRRLI